MATPSDTITTVSGRRCTRTRRATAAASSSAALTSSLTSSVATTSQISSSTPPTSIASSTPPPPPSATPPLTSAAVPQSGSGVPASSPSASPTPVTTSSAATTAGAAPVLASSSPSTVSLSSSDLLATTPARGGVGSQLSSFTTSASEPNSSAEASPAVTANPALGSPSATVPSAHATATSVDNSGIIADDSTTQEVSHVGVAVGVVVGIIALIGFTVLCVLLYRRRRRKDDGHEGSEKRMDLAARRSGHQSGLRDRFQGLAAIPAKVVAKASSSIAGLFNPLMGRNSRDSGRSSPTSSQPQWNGRSSPRPRLSLLGFGQRISKLTNSLLFFRRSTRSERVTSPISRPSISESDRLRNGSVSSESDQMYSANRVLRVSNPDASQPGTPALSPPRKDIAEGLAEQQRGPLTPGRLEKEAGSAPPATAATASTVINSDPFVDPPSEARTRHQRSRSSFITPPASMLLPTPAIDSSNYYYPPDSGTLNPFADPLPPPSRISASSRSYVPSFVPDTASLPPASRPWTRMTIGSRTMKGQSDPFDLDRPEILEYSSRDGSSVSSQRGRRSNASSQDGRLSPSMMNFNFDSPRRSPVSPMVSHLRGRTRSSNAVGVTGIAR